jgi:hypothetical protein
MMRHFFDEAAANMINCEASQELGNSLVDDSAGSAMQLFARGSLWYSRCENAGLTSSADVAGAEAEKG